MLKKPAILLLPVLALMALILAACAAPLSAPTATQPLPPTSEPGETEQQPVDTPTRPKLTLPAGAVPIETVEITPIVGEVPDELMAAIVADLVDLQDVEAQAIEVIQAEAVVWNDGSLGCPQPGQVYTQALVNGYHVILEVGSQTYDYRVAESGYFFLCENTLPNR